MDLIWFGLYRCHLNKTFNKVVHMLSSLMKENVLMFVFEMKSKRHHHICRNSTAMITFWILHINIKGDSNTTFLMRVKSFKLWLWECYIFSFNLTYVAQFIGYHVLPKFKIVQGIFCEKFSSNILFFKEKLPRKWKRYKFFYFPAETHV